jgi:pimeloyl-ACP methyl ester carboxylesterase
MPAVSLHQGLHFVQLWRSGRFRLYDYGTPAANAERYGHAAPPEGELGVSQPQGFVLIFPAFSRPHIRPITPPHLATHPTPPPPVAAEYWRLDVPVDICAGSHDGVIPPANVRRHVAAMRAAGVDVSYREFGYG